MSNSAFTQGIIQTPIPVSSGGTGGADAATARTNLGVPSGSGSSSGTNTGDQTSIVGITGTKAQFNTALTDGDFLYVGDGGLTNQEVLARVSLRI